MYRTYFVFCFLLVLCTVGLPRGAMASFVIEEGGLKITLPPDAKKKYPGGFDMALANFGSPKYGGSLIGQLIYIDAEYGYDVTCSPPCRYACQSFASATPPLDLRNRDGKKDAYIMIVDRGPIEPGTKPCVFAEKVWNAQMAGAGAVLVVNYEDKLATMDAPDEEEESSYKYLKNITIPSSFVTKSTGQALKSLIKSYQTVFAALDWTDSLPRKTVVDLEFWTGSNDMCGPKCDEQRDFIKHFQPVAEELDQAGWARFTPHYIVWTCPDQFKESVECQSECINHGRYCAPDPDGSIAEGYSGAEVVLENLRQLCVFELANATKPPRPHLWWTYTTRFGEKCTMSTKLYGQDCAEEVFNEINVDGWTTLDELRRCIGNPDDDTTHAIMEKQLISQAGDDSEGEVFILPTLRINGAQYRGKLAVNEVLQAICAGFEKGNRPKSCDRALDEPCMIGGSGQLRCAANKDGKTQCVPALGVDGYICTCGQGFISQIAEDGSEICLDINECLSISDLHPNCTCDRCACKNIFGGYECITDIPNECASNYGGCWHQDYKINGKKTTINACRDNIDIWQDFLSHGKSIEGVPLHNCTCPPCFENVQKGNKLVCEPTCNLDNCDLNLGICKNENNNSNQMNAGFVAGIVLLTVACTALVGFAAYKVWLRGQMQAEVRAIMAQYMPLAETDVESKEVLRRTRPFP